MKKNARARGKLVSQVSKKAILGRFVLWRKIHEASNGKNASITSGASYAEVIF
jgi:hypothetical protein